MQGFERSLAVVIGINGYTNGVPRLSTPINDAKRLAHVLQTDFGYQTHLLVEEVTKARLLALFAEQLPAIVRETDRILIYFAGHGIALDGEDGPEGFLIPQDADAQDRDSFLAMSTVHDGLARLACRHLLSIFDCCFAGAFRWSSTRHLRLVSPEVLHREHYERFVREPAWQVLTSAAYDQAALDVLAGEVLGRRDASEQVAGQHSPFAAALFAALAGKADLIPRGRGDGVITATELYLYLRDTVEIDAEAQARHRQTPGLWPLQRHDKGEYVFLLPNHELNLPPAPPLSVANNPYRGLQSYDEKDAELFFGRTALIEQLAELVEANSLTVVLGASGTGKSSLVKAGLVPYLKQRALTEATLSTVAEAATYTILPPVRPGDDSLLAVANVLRLAPTVTTAGLVMGQEQLEQLILQHIDDWMAQHPQQKYLAIIDQFEELVTQSRDANRRRFLALLARLLTQHPTQMRVVITLRTDFEPQFVDSPLTPFWHKGRFVVPPLTQSEFREIIEEPAARRVLYFDPPTLVDRLVEDVNQTPGALPLLSFTLSELYLRYLNRQGEAQLAGIIIERALTAEDYDALGGVIGSLRTRADELYQQFDANHCATMQRVMLRMIAIDGGEIARRRVLAEELVYLQQAENQRVQTVIEQLVDARLLVRGGGVDIDGDDIPDEFVEPAHDALVLAWDKLLLWKQEADEYLPLQRRLTRATGEWQRADERDKVGLLWNDDPGLPQILPDIIKQQDLLDTLLSPWETAWPSATTANAPTWLNQREDAFITSSVQRRATIRRRITAITAMVFAGLLGLTIYAFIQNSIAQRRAAESQSAALASGAQQAIQNLDYDLAIALALEANQIEDPPEPAQNTLAIAAYAPGTVARFTEHEAWITRVALSGDGTTALSLSRDHKLLAWNPQTATQLYRIEADTVITPTMVAYSPVDDIALLGSATGGIVVWDVTNRTQRALLRGHTSRITALAFSNDGQQALSGDQSGGLLFWDVQEGDLIRQLDGLAGRISAAAINSDSTQALTGDGDGAITLWDLETGTVVRQFGDHQDEIMALTFGVRGDQIISGGRDRHIRIWDVRTGRRLGGFDLEEHTQFIGSITIAPDGATVASGSGDGSVLIWDLQVNRLLRTFVGHRASVLSLAFDRDSQQLLSGSRDTSARLWDIRGPTQQRRIHVEQRRATTSFIDTVHNTIVDPARNIGLSGAPDGLIQWAYDTEQEQQRFLRSATPAIVRNALVFRVRTFDPAVGRQDGDGIDRVAMSILDADGRVLWERPSDPQSPYCVFGERGGCMPLDFSDWGNQWPDETGRRGGPPIQSGPHTLHATIYTEDGISTTLATVIDIQLPKESGNESAFANIPPLTSSITGAGNLVAEVAQTEWIPRQPSAVLLHPTLPLVLQGTYTGDLILWDLETQQWHALPKMHEAQLITLVYLPDDRVLSADRRGTVVAWDWARLQPDRQYNLTDGRLVWHISFDAAGERALYTTEDHNAVLWDLTTGEEIQRFAGHEDAVYWGAIAADGSSVLTGSADRRAILWDVASGNVRRRFEGHRLPLHVVAFGPTEFLPGVDTILSGAEDRSVRLWNVETGAEIFRFEGHATTIQNLFYLPETKEILSRANDGEVIVWNLPSTELQTLQSYANEQRYNRAVTCDERILYNILPLCAEGP